jgi:HAAS domain-containing protein
MVMTANEQTVEVTTYATKVRARLADLPATEADVLLEDLEQHLAEVAAEGEGSLVERLGPPEDYAAELRAAYRAGHPSPQTNGAHLADRVRAAIDRLTRKRWVQQTRAFLPSLRPAWWVLRAYLAVLILAAALGPVGPLPSPVTKRGLAEIVATAVAIWLSVRLGRRQRALPKAARVAALSLNVLIAFVAFVILENMGNFPASPTVGTASQEQSMFGSALAAGQVTNIYPYSQDGKPLTNVLLYDQDGRPITLDQGEAQTSFPIGADGKAIVNAYPLTQRHADGTPVVAPRVALPPWPSPSASPSASASPTASPSPTR